MKRLILIFGVAAVAAAALAFSGRDARVRLNTMLGPIPVGGLTKVEVMAKVRRWWESEKGREVTVRAGDPPKTETLKISQLGLEPDSAASAGQLSYVEPRGLIPIPPSGPPEELDLKFKSVQSPAFERFLAKNVPLAHPARVLYQDGAIVRKPETSGMEVDEAQLAARVQDVIRTDGNEVEVPLHESEKHMADENLNDITDVLSTFTTRFPVRKVDRNTNIRIASGKIDGTVIPPGGTFSFNTIVGKRTIQDGFRVAPVFKNGKHDMGVGGGICQVSSTLYNAALFSDLKILQRHNHSMPVPYLPPGRDATVDYGMFDLVFQNDKPTAIAISTEYKPGRLVFRILGKKDPSMTVKIESTGSESWDAGTKTLPDPTMPIGKKKVIEKGCRGRSIRTFRVVYRNGVEVSREPLGRSYYKGGVRIVAVGTKVVPGVALPGAPVPAPSNVPPVAPAPTTPPSAPGIDN